MTSKTKRIVDLFYTFEDVARNHLDAEFVSMLKDAEMYINITMKIINKATSKPKGSGNFSDSANRRGLDQESIEILKHWIFYLSSKK